MGTLEAGLTRAGLCVVVADQEFPDHAKKGRLALGVKGLGFRI